MSGGPDDEVTFNGSAAKVAAGGLGPFALADGQTLTLRFDGGPVQTVTFDAGDFADVTLERGATQDRDLFDWFQDVAITSSGLGLTDVYYKRNLDIVQQDRDGTTLRRWSLSRAWPVKFVAGDWDNEADENVIESVTLSYDFFELVQ